MTIAAILEGKPGDIVSVEAGTSVREAVALLAEKRIGAMPVLEGDRVVGIMSERDVIYCLSSDGAAMLDWPVSRVMTAPAITIESKVGVLVALSQMTKRRIRHLPVVEGDRLIGSTESDRIMLPVGDHSFEFANDSLGFRTTRAVKSRLPTPT